MLSTYHNHISEGRAKLKRRKEKVGPCKYTPVCKWGTPICDFTTKRKDTKISQKSLLFFFLCNTPKGKIWGERKPFLKQEGRGYQREHLLLFEWICILFAVYFTVKWQLMKRNMARHNSCIWQWSHGNATSNFKPVSATPPPWLEMTFQSAPPRLQVAGQWTGGGGLEGDGNAK